jgi:hypothetical protein
LQQRLIGSIQFFCNDNNACRLLERAATITVVARHHPTGLIRIFCGYCSSSAKSLLFGNNEQVIEGAYTLPNGAQRVGFFRSKAHAKRVNSCAQRPQNGMGRSHLVVHLLKFNSGVPKLKVGIH